MSFTGELEHLPIVDVIQLLHSARKSGILRFSSRKGESQLVFKDGFIVSANHLNNSVRIGKILVDLNIITQETLTQALQAQLGAGKDRKPLVVTLIEMGVVEEKDAYKGLEQLIELTVVEILTWKKGTFALDVRPSAVSDEYRYYPERISREINVDTQGILMESLRIFDEKMRDGELTDEDFPEEEIPTIEADDWGEPVLADSDRQERKSPAVLSGPAECNSAPAAIQRQTQEEIAPSLTALELEQLGAFLGGFSSVRESTGESVRSLVLLSPDRLICHYVTAVCTPAGIPVSFVSTEQELDPILDQALAGLDIPILVIDAPRQSDDRFSPQELSSLRQRKRLHYPEICVIQLAAPGDAEFTLQSYSDGVRAVLPKPSLYERREAYVEETIRFLTAFKAYLEVAAFERESFAAARIKTAITRLHDLRYTTSIASNLLECVAGICERSLTLIVHDSALVAENGIGINGGKEGGEVPATGVRIPLARPSLLRDVIEWGFVYYGPIEDEAIRKHLFAAIGPPSCSTMLLLPIRRHGITVAIAYGDFGDRESVPLDVGLLKILAIQAELVLENTFYWRKLSKAGRQGTAVR
ncbi:MAG: DUF4388 domain-containing protein [Deltaproteobacteria bacterium]|nr:DUF4388 domain-containing protein [Deltaproteobacteria bacterium]